MAVRPRRHVNRRPWSRTRQCRRIRPVRSLARPPSERSRREDSNLRPSPSQSGAHPLSYDESWSLEESNLDPVGASHVCWPLTPRPRRKRPPRLELGLRRWQRRVLPLTPRSQRHGRKESNPHSRGWSPRRRHVTSAQFLERDSNRAPSGSEPEILPIRRSRIEAAAAGLEPAFPG